MRHAWGLQSRFLLATSVLIAVVCCVFGVAVHEFIELLEDELLNRTLVREMAQFKLDVAAQPQAPLPSQGGLQGFIIRTRADAASVPREVAGLSLGVHEDINVRGRNYYVDVQDSAGARLYLLLDTQQVEALEGNVTEVAFLVGLAALGLAAVVALSLSRAVLRPVAELARDVAQLDPTRRNAHLKMGFANREVGIIAGAFDDYMARLERVLEREQAFTEDASHELRTPLAIIASAAELLTEEACLSADGRERVVRIRRASAQMQSLIEALLFLARGEVSARPQPCAIDQIVRESLDVISAGAAAKSIDLQVEIEPVTVTGPAVMVACVINNLLLNAVNFTQTGSIFVELNAAQLIVRDTGIGISPQDLSRIFERRYRGAQSRGLGLGLYLVNRICERLGWTIETQSSAGAGTTFRIRFAASTTTGNP